VDRGLRACAAESTVEELCSSVLSFAVYGKFIVDGKVLSGTGPIAEDASSEGSPSGLSRTPRRLRRESDVFVRAGYIFRDEY